MVCTREKSASIAGGFVLVNVGALAAAWRACRERPLGTGDFRAWLALREMVARRCGLGSGRAPAYSPGELAGLLGVTERRARASIRRLVYAGLVGWSADGPTFPNLADRGLGDDGPGAGLADSIGGGRGPVAIPRRILRLLAGGARPALIATALGTLLRCLSRRRGGWDGRGRVKAAWIARVFGVDLRRVKQARAELVALGWISPEASDQRAENRWGRGYRINLGWDRARPHGRRLPPPPAVERSPIATPSVDPEPLPERGRNQEPAGRGPVGTGARLEGREEGLPPASAPKPATTIPTAPVPAPNLDDVRPEDLRDVGRALELHRQAVARGLANPSEAGRLRFLAVAEHARAVGTVNPGGLFARLVRRGWWHFATMDDEDTARRRLRDHLHGRTPARPTPVPTVGTRRASTFRPDTPPPAGPTALAGLLSRWGIPGTEPGGG